MGLLLTSSGSPFQACSVFSPQDHLATRVSDASVLLRLQANLTMKTAFPLPALTSYPMTKECGQKTSKALQKEGINRELTTAVSSQTHYVTFGPQHLSAEWEGGLCDSSLNTKSPKAQSWIWVIAFTQVRDKNEQEACLGFWDVFNPSQRSTYIT